MTTHVDVLRAWAGTWRNLRAWRAQLPVTVTFVRHAGTACVGVAHCAQRYAVCYYREGMLAADLAVVLHELAHLAVPTGSGHDAVWRDRYADAVHEVTGVEIAPVANGLMDLQATDALGTWLDATGQRAVLRAIGVTC